MGWAASAILDAQRLPSAVRRDGDEHEASARADARCLTRSQERRLRECRKAMNRWPKRRNVTPPILQNPPSQPQPIAPSNAPHSAKISNKTSGPEWARSLASVPADTGLPCGELRSIALGGKGALAPGSQPIRGLPLPRLNDIERC